MILIITNISILIYLWMEIRLINK